MHDQEQFVAGWWILPLLGLSLAMIGGMGRILYLLF